MSSEDLLKWSWNSWEENNSWNLYYADATSVQTNAAYQAVVGQLATSNFHYKVWNDLIEWVRHCLTVIEVSYTAETVSAAKMTNNSRTLTPSRYNAMQALREAFCSAADSEYASQSVQDGDVVRPHHFLSLVEDMNSAIDELLSRE